MPVPAADERSVSSSPVSHRSTQSLSPTHQLTAAHVAASWRANQRSLVSGVMGCTGTPVSRYSSSPPSGRAAPRPRLPRATSAHVTSGVRGRSPGRGPAARAWRWRPRPPPPRRRRGRDTHSPSAVAAGPRRASGSCTSQPGWGVCIGCSATAASCHCLPDAEGHGLHTGGAHVEPDDDLTRGRRDERGHGSPVRSMASTSEATVATRSPSSASAGSSTPSTRATAPRVGPAANVTSSAARTSVTGAPPPAEVAGPGGEHAGGTGWDRAGGPCGPQRRAATRTGSFWEPSAAICARRWASRGLPNRSSSCSSVGARPRGRQRQVAGAASAHQRRQPVAAGGVGDGLGDGGVAADRAGVGQQRVPAVEQPELALLRRARHRRRTVAPASLPAPVGRRGTRRSITHSLNGSVDHRGPVVASRWRAPPAARSSDRRGGRDAVDDGRDEARRDSSSHGARPGSTASARSRNDLPGDARRSPGGCRTARRRSAPRLRAAARRGRRAAAAGRAADRRGAGRRRSAAMSAPTSGSVAVEAARAASRQ